MEKKTASKKQPYKKQVEAISEISRAISSDLSIDEILKLVVNVTAGLLRSNICSIQLIDEEKNELVIRATQSISEEYNRKPPLKIGEGIAGKVAADKRPTAVEDITQEKEYKYHDIAKKEGLASLLCIPLCIRGRAIGVINLYTPKRHEFSKGEIDALSSIASLAAIAIENTELLDEKRRMHEELRERKLLERAKGLLMKEEGLSEEEAYLRIQKFSMDSRKSIGTVAESVIMAYNLRRR